MEEFFSVLVPIFIFISVISSIIKANNKKAKTQNNNYNRPVNKTANYNNTHKPNYTSKPNPFNKPAANDKPKVDDVFDLKNYKTETPEERRQRQDLMYNKKLSTSISNTGIAAKPVNASKKVYLEGDSLEFQNIRPNLASWTDKHPFEMNKSLKKEQVYLESTLTDKNVEGCEEHYNTRLVMVDKDTDKEISFTELQKMIVFGEIINSPKYKEY